MRWWEKITCRAVVGKDNMPCGVEEDGVSVKRFWRSWCAVGSGKGFVLVVTSIDFLLSVCL